MGGRAGISTSREEHPDAPRSVQSTAGQAQAVSVGLDEGQLGDVHDAATPKDAVPATAVAVDFEHRFARVQLGTSDGTAEIGAVGYRPGRQVGRRLDGDVALLDTQWLRGGRRRWRRWLGCDGCRWRGGRCRVGVVGLGCTGRSHALGSSLLHSRRLDGGGRGVGLIGCRCRRPM
ncbi:MAG TPA: hypothetical protein VK694_07000 [Verrucomicrobiae bacterium]|nr:hypothetical protein [Verrucomicrobiae bacterium]